MRLRTPILFVIAVTLSIFGAAYGNDDFVVHGRVSFDTGGLLVKNASEEDWALAAVNTMVLPGDTLWADEEGTAEIELPDSSFLRMADASKAEITSLPPNSLLRAWVGSFYIHRLAKSQGSFTMISPAATLVAAPDSMIRLDVDEEGSVVVSVRWGSAAIHAQQNHSITVTEGTRVWIDPGFLPSDPVAFDRNATDAFDNWNNDRARILAEGSQTIPREIYTDATPTVGSYDLARYGDWVQVDNRSYWRPTVVVDYVPYRYGYWNYMPAAGHVWVDEYPFGYITSHYGRWRHTATYGWIWSYDSVWSPAWVASVHVSGYHLWAPVDYYHRPVFVTGGTFFSVGGVSFCSFGSSYVSSTYLYGGPSYIGAPNTTIINVFNNAPARNVNIWNLSPYANRRPSVPWAGGLQAHGRDYNPRRSIRGFQSDSNRALAFSDRIGHLEHSLGRDSFAPRRLQSSTTAPGRTNIQGRNTASGVRTVRMNQTEQTYRPRGAQQEGSGDNNSRRLVPESARLGRSPLNAGDRPTGGETSVARGTAGRTREGAGTADRPTSPRGGSGVRENPSNVAVRDLDSSAPAPRGSSQVQRAPSREGQGTPGTTDRGRGVRSETGTAAPVSPRSGTERTAPATRPAPTTTRGTTTPAPATRQAPTTTRGTAAPAPATRPAPTTTRGTAAPAPVTRPAPTTTRGTAAPVTRSAPAPTRTAPVTRQAPAPSAPRMAPSPAPSTRSMPAPSAPRVAPSPAPSTRSMPAPSVSRMAPAPAPSTRSMPAPSVSRMAPAPAPSTRSMPAPNVSRMAPAPAPSTRSMPAPSVSRMAPSPAPSVRSMPSTSAPRGFSAPSVGSRSAPSAPRGFSAPSVRPAPSMGGGRGRR